MTGAVPMSSDPGAFFKCISKTELQDAALFSKAFCIIQLLVETGGVGGLAVFCIARDMVDKDAVRGLVVAMAGLQVGAPVELAG